MSRTSKSPCALPTGFINVMDQTRRMIYLYIGTMVKTYLYGLIKPNRPSRCILQRLEHSLSSGNQRTVRTRVPYVFDTHMKRESTDALVGHIQIDDPTFCYFCDERMIAGMQRSGVNHEALLETYIRAINLITRGRPKDLTASIHMCRGNYKVCSAMYRKFDGSS